MLIFDASLIANEELDLEKAYRISWGFLDNLRWKKVLGEEKEEDK